MNWTDKREEPLSAFLGKYRDPEANVNNKIAPLLMVSSKVDFVPFCHSVFDTESSEFSYLWIPAFAGMTVFGLLTSSSLLTFRWVYYRQPSLL
jgi:hypothetical protein